MIVVIRISGQVEMHSYSVETLHRLRLRKKYSAILMKEGEETTKMLQQIRNFVAYGPIDPATLGLLISKRGKPLAPSAKSIDYKKAAEVAEKEGLQKAGLKPFFRLHPPRKGIDSKTHYPKGILGDNGKDINDLVRRML